MPYATESRLEQQDCEGKHDWKYDEGDEQVRPQGDPSGLIRHVALQSPPDKVFVQLVHAEEEREGGKEKMVAATSNMSGGVDPDRSYTDPGNQVRLRREAHERS